MKDNLHNLRKHIDDIDKQLLRLLNQRGGLAKEIFRVKQGAGVYRPEREAHIMSQLIASNQGPLSNNAITAIFREIIAAARELEKPLTIAYLGPEGTYSEEVARRQYGETSVYTPCTSIDESIRIVEAHEADVCVVPVENSTEGAVNRTYDLLLQTHLTICGESSLAIHHQLLTKAKKLEDIEEIVAHPQTLAQCRIWLDEHLPAAKQISAKSNAEAARLAARNSKRAAIASARAGEIYNLSVLMPNIEDDPSNTTRFVMLGTTETAPSGLDKTSLVCSTPDKPGALFKVLGILADQKVNMVKLESRPAPNTLWDYIFYIDIEGHKQEKKITRTLELLKEQTAFLRILGSYPKGV